MAGRRWFVHPILFGLYFVLSLAASNTAELKSSADLLWPLSISLLVSALCWLEDKPFDLVRIKW